MTTRDEIRHLLRRFGFGPSLAELKEYEPLGVQGAIDRLVRYEKVDERFPISPWEICFEDKLPDMYVDAPRIGAWWALRMFLTKRPLQENLTLFWHNHFAVSAQKIEFGPMMADYLQAIRSQANGHFPTLVQSVSTTPAMVRWLDTDTSITGKPNENFARELLELFTMGIGAYTETDIQEAARAFTGWGIRYLIFESGAENLQARLKECVKLGQPMVAFCLSPELHDTGRKSVLGQSGPLEGYQMMEIASKRPETAKRISSKLWEWYGYYDPEPKLVEKLADTFRSGEYRIDHLLSEMAKLPEFWSKRAIRQKVKSPAEFIVGIMRQFDLQPLLALSRPANSKADTPLPKSLRDTAGLLWGSMYQQGLALLYPPNVGGWNWGEAWLTSANMAERMKFAGLIFGVSQPDKVLSTYLGNKIRTEFKATSAEDVVEALLEIFDAQFPSEKRSLLVKACKDAGGPNALDSAEPASKVLHAVCRLIFSSPEFQMC